MSLNSILCLVQSILDAIFGALNQALGIFGVEITAPGVGCEVVEE